MRRRLNFLLLLAIVLASSNSMGQGKSAAPTKTVPLSKELKPFKWMVGTWSPREGKINVEDGFWSYSFGAPMHIAPSKDGKALKIRYRCSFNYSTFFGGQYEVTETISFDSKIKKFRLTGKMKSIQKSGLGGQTFSYELSQSKPNVWTATGVPKRGAKKAVMVEFHRTEKGLKRTGFADVMIKGKPKHFGRDMSITYARRSAQPR